MALWRAWAGICRRWRRGSLRGRCCTWRHVPSFHVADVALGDMCLRFTWQAWHLATSTWAFCVAGVALMARGRRGTWRHVPSFHVAAWHLTTSTFVLRGRRGTYDRRSGHISFRQLQVRSDAACQCLAWTPFMFCGVLHFLTTAMKVSFCVATAVSEMLRSQVLFRFQMPSRWHWSAGAKKSPQRCRTSVPSLDLFMLCASLHLHTIFYTLPQTIFHTSSFTHNFVTRSLSHTHTTFTQAIFHTQLCHTHTIFLCHTPSFTHNFVTHTHHLSLSHTNFHMQLCHTQPPPPPLSFLPSPSLLQHFLPIIGRSWLVGLSGPLIIGHLSNHKHWVVSKHVILI